MDMSMLGIKHLSYNTHTLGDQVNEEIHEVALTKELMTNNTTGRYHKEQADMPKVIELKDVNNSFKTMQICIPLA
jgi:hypothetical protein